MKKRISRWTALFLLTVCVCGTAASASDGSSYQYDGYTYDFWGNVQEGPAAFILERVIDEGDMEGMALQGLNDVSVSGDGRIFLTDTQASRVYVMDSEGNYLNSIKTVKDGDGKIGLDENGNQIMLSNPEGTFCYDAEKELYIADTGAKRVLVLDLDTCYLKRVITEPDNLSGSTEFKPSKVAVDHAGRIFLVIQSSYDGIVELSREGTFIGYYGVNTPTVNLIDYFWKSIASDSQKAKMSKSYAPAFNNIAIDGEGFVMAVTSDQAAEDMIFRLNSKGENVIREEGNTFLIGDNSYLNDPSRFVDLAVTDYGLYAVLDRTVGRIFIYDFDGELLNVFGMVGDVKGEFRTPTGLAWLGEKLVATDSTLRCAYILQPTDFGRAMLKGAEYYYNGQWDEALEHFEEAIRLNGNYEMAYSAIGKNYLMKDDYEKAMYYFKLGNNRKYYSKAYYGYRGEMIREHFGVIAAVIVILLVLLIYTEIQYHRKGAKPKR